VSEARKVGWRAAYLVAAVGVYMADQASKAWAARRLRFGDTVTVVERLLYFDYATNDGIAFGQLQEGGEFSRWMLAALAALALVAVLVYFFRTPRAEDRVLGACALLLAGIAGNLTDRVRLGHVIDFVEVHLGSFQWPTFNVADAAICVGAGLLALDIILEGSQKSGVRSQKKAEEPETAN